ncbi:MAG: class I SAM-dependent methyltransferase [Anaerolineae bacterium]
MEAEKRTEGNDQYWDAGQISEGGERVSHLVQDHVYHGHLSIYHFAARFCQGGRVLDAGSGAGYGAAYLADHGARHVLGIDASERAVTFSRYHFPRPNLGFQCLDLERIDSLLPRRFDFIFCSNTLEHVPDARGVVRGFWQLLEPGGVLLLAVPPITDDHLLYLNLINPHHLNLWSPRQWTAVLGDFFQQTTPYLHGVGRIGQDEDGRAAGRRLCHRAWNRGRDVPDVHPDGHLGGAWATSGRGGTGGRRAPVLCRRLVHPDDGPHQPPHALEAALPFPARMSPAGRWPARTATGRTG